MYNARAPSAARPAGLAGEETHVGEGRFTVAMPLGRGKLVVHAKEPGEAALHGGIAAATCALGSYALHRAFGLPGDYLERAVDAGVTQQIAGNLGEQFRRDAIERDVQRMNAELAAFFREHWRAPKPSAPTP